jgi:hypothetical protein
MASHRLVVTSFLVAVAALGLLAYRQAIEPTVSRARQVRTCADMQSYRAMLDAYHSKHSRFPDSLQDAVREGVAKEHQAFFLKAEDAWGHPLLYESQGSGSAYILVSYGLDGLPDGMEYWWLRTTYGERRYAPEACPTFNADIIASDLAFHRPCGK